MIDFENFDPFGPEAGFKRIFPRKDVILLEYAADNNLPEFKSLLAELIESDDKDYDIKECLEYAIGYKSHAIIQEIIEVQGIKPDFSDCHTAMKHGQFEILDYLLSHGADPHEDDDMLIHVAASFNQVKSLEVLAKYGADNYTPLINDFILTNQTKVVIYMLENGAIPNIQTLEQAAKIEDLTILKHLVADKGMVPSKEFINSLPALFSEAKHLLTKAYLQNKLTNKLTTKTKSQTKKI